MKRVKSEPSSTGSESFALWFGLFLGLCLLKFGNPVILDHKIIPPDSLNDLWNNFWPTHWAKWFLLPLIAAAIFFIFKNKQCWPVSHWLWGLPLIWFGWQLLAGLQSVDKALTVATIWQFFGCIACYFIGALMLKSQRSLNYLFLGLSVAFAICLIQAIKQRLFEFPESQQILLEGQSNGWTNFPPDVFLEMKSNHTVITTNGMDVANPAILDKFAKGRVYGTLVYPNALAGMILLLLPAAMVLVFNHTKLMKFPIRIASIALVLLLGGMAFFWTGSKLGWLIAIGLAGLWLFRLRWRTRTKWIVVGIVLLAGLGIFAVRFHNYFKAGATSTTARLDYWRAAMQTTVEYPVLGSGPGTFQYAYARHKAPESEMTRLTHNDYLEQFSDSGIAGGLVYVSWIVIALIIIGRQLWKSADLLVFALFVGVAGWFLQGLGEFSLYIPATAWTAFTFLGCLLALPVNEFDKKPPVR